MHSSLKRMSGALLLAALCGCATPRYLVSDFTMGERSVKYILTPISARAGKNEVQLYDFIVQICDLDTKDEPSACKDTTVVSNVVPQSIY